MVLVKSSLCKIIGPLSNIEQNMKDEALVTLLVYDLRTCDDFGFFFLIFGDGIATLTRLWCIGLHWELGKPYFLQ